MDWGKLIQVRRYQRQNPNAYVAPIFPTPEWPTLPQTGTFAHWGDDVLANLSGGAARAMWDWPARYSTVEAFTPPEVVLRWPTP